MAQGQAVAQAAPQGQQEQQSVRATMLYKSEGPRFASYEQSGEENPTCGTLYVPKYVLNNLLKAAGLNINGHRPKGLILKVSLLRDGQGAVETTVAVAKKKAPDAE